MTTGHSTLAYTVEFIAMKTSSVDIAASSTAMRGQYEVSGIMTRHAARRAIQAVDCMQSKTRSRHKLSKEFHGKLSTEHACV